MNSRHLLFSAVQFKQELICSAAQVVFSDIGISFRCEHLEIEGRARRECALQVNTSFISVLIPGRV